MRYLIWIGLTLSGFIYQGIKYQFGYNFNVEAVLDASYWSGSALLVHWLMTRK